MKSGLKNRLKLVSRTMTLLIEFRYYDNLLNANNDDHNRSLSLRR